MAAGSGRVALVEDDAGMREALERVLVAAGFMVSAFSSAEAALLDRSTLDSDCLVLDIHLPGLSGFELYERLVAVGRKPPVIFITARDDPVHQDRARQLGALDYLVKPFSGRALSAIVSKAFA
ncbi:MAG: response regulator [Betaproteobacteria bacterium]